MTRAFCDAKPLLSHLIDRYEKGSLKPFAHVAREKFTSIDQRDEFYRVVGDVAQSGAIRLVHDRTRTGEIKAVHLIDPAAIYSVLNRQPAAVVAEAAVSETVAGIRLDARISQQVDEAAASWAQGKAWAGIGVDRKKVLFLAVRLAQAILDGQHEGLDYRTFSRRVVADSKAMEGCETLVRRLLNDCLDFPPEADCRDSFAAIGLPRRSLPVFISGPLTTDTGVTLDALPYVGLRIEDILTLTISRMPAYVLTIENFASFERHALEINQRHDGIVIYTGGFPSRDVVRTLRHLGEALPPGVPFFHWSDIDAAGAWIFHRVEIAAGRRVHPHLMDRETARRHGTAAPRKQLLAIDAQSGIADLAAFLSSPDARVMEQEELDPAFPDMPRTP